MAATEDPTVVTAAAVAVFLVLVVLAIKVRRRWVPSSVD